ncbi:beta-lactamase family protein [Olivibacter sp. SDN3]|uniref:serine hydrolase domain-containing protein n=1 Tax=Olivibacter sp. SDN3 TaxID=2764720 RepID=UPI0016515F93|nr:serine hydrolase domain-containing protein [Olivibacter sp. SDN3]QNL48004.1 beta-lactamase family protein [Olivibacter sp. SDN3]
MVKLPKKLFFIYFLLFSACIQAFAQNTALEEELQTIMKKNQAIGLSIAVVKDNKIAYNASFGVKDIATNQPLRNNDIFRIASISKSFVATGIMQLVEQGKLSLDDDVGELIGFKVRNPKYPNIKITLRMILSHTSSLNDQNGYFTLDVICPQKSLDISKSYYEYAPGEGYQYCNLNFNLAGAILEKISGERLDRYIKQHLLDPLKIYGGYNVDELDSSRFVTLYEFDKTSGKFDPAPAAYRSPKESLNNYVMGYSTPIFSPTGGIKISAHDLAIYMMMHMNEGLYNNDIRIISPNSTKNMQTNVNIEERYGLALCEKTLLVPGKKLIGHNGNAYGLYSAMFFQPEEKFGFVLITNGCGATTFTEDVNDFLKACVDSLYRHLIDQ